MGKQPRDRVKPISPSSWLIDVTAQLLEPDDREVVCGDFAETGESGAKAFIDLLGLIVRRQGALWTGWRPWAALILVVLPLGMLLSLISRLWADSTSIDAWVYLGHWDWSLFRYPSLRADLLRVLLLTIRDYVALVCWAWTCGFAMASLSRRTAWVNVGILWIVLCVGTVGSSTTLRNGVSGQSQLFGSIAISVLLPFLVKTLLVAVPAIFGVRRALSAATISLRTALLWTIAIVAITVSNHTAVEGSASFFGWRPFGPLPDPGFDRRLGTDDDIVDWRLRLLSLVVMWPATLMLLQTAWTRWRHGDDDQRRTRGNR